jgi:hypothetical protein
MKVCDTEDIGMRYSTMQWLNCTSSISLNGNVVIFLGRTCSQAEVDWKKAQSSQCSVSDVGFHIPNSRRCVGFPRSKSTKVIFNINALIGFGSPIETRSSNSAFRDLKWKWAIELKRTLSKWIIVGGADNMFE